MAVVITADDRQAFKRCRRAWDLGSRLRESWEPDTDVVDADLGEAVRAAGAYRRRAPVEEKEGRLGGVTWSIGRGAAPPKFGRGPGPGR